MTYPLHRQVTKSGWSTRRPGRSPRQSPAAAGPECGGPHVASPRSVAAGSPHRRRLPAAAEAPGPAGCAVLASNDGPSHLQPLQDITAAQLDQMPAVNLRAPFLLAQRAAGSIREPGSGRISLISRAAAFTGGIAGPHHAASTAGPHALTPFLASRLTATGITVNAPALALAAETRMLPGHPAQLRGRCRPQARPAIQVTGLAAAILAKAYLTNQVISLDGGIYPGRHRTVFATGCGRPGRAPADIGSAVIHDRYHHQDDDRYAALCR